MAEESAETEAKTEGRYRLPVLPLFETVVFPHMLTPIQVGRQPSLLAVDEAVKQRPHRIVLVTQNNSSKQDVGPDDLMVIGVLASLGPMFRLPDGSVQLLAQGEQRVNIIRYTQSEPFLEVEVEVIAQDVQPSRELTALMETVKSCS
jgi:ATP-dependent Lon protease